jgi:hypothetical protein
MIGKLTFLIRIVALQPETMTSTALAVPLRFPASTMTVVVKVMQPF